MNNEKFDLKPTSQVTIYDGFLGDLEYSIEADALPDDLVRTPFEIKAGKLKNPMAMEIYEILPEYDTTKGILVKFKYVAHSESPQWEEDHRVDTTTTLTFKGKYIDIDLKLKIKGKESAWKDLDGKEHDFLFARISSANQTLDDMIEKEAKDLLGNPDLDKITYSDEGKDDKVLYDKKKSKQTKLGEDVQ